MVFLKTTEKMMSMSDAKWSHGGEESGNNADGEERRPRRRRPRPPRKREE